MDPNEIENITVKRPDGEGGRRRATAAYGTAAVALVAIGVFLATRRGQDSGGSGGSWLLTADQRAEHSTLPDEKVPLAEPGVGEARPSGGGPAGGEGGNWRDRVAARMGGGGGEPPAPGRAATPGGPFAAGPFAGGPPAKGGGQKPIVRAAFRKEGGLGGGGESGGPAGLAGPAKKAAGEPGIGAREILKGMKLKDPLSDVERKTLHAALVQRQRAGAVMMGGMRLPNASRITGGNPVLQGSLAGSGAATGPEIATGGVSLQGTGATETRGVVASGASPPPASEGGPHMAGSISGASGPADTPASVAGTSTNPGTSSSAGPSTPQSQSGHYDMSQLKAMLAIAREYVQGFRRSFVEGPATAVNQIASAEFEKYRDAEVKVREAVALASSKGANGPSYRQATQDVDHTYGTSFEALFDHVVVFTGDLDGSASGDPKPDQQDLGIWKTLANDRDSLDPKRAPPMVRVVEAEAEEHYYKVATAFGHRALLGDALRKIAAVARAGESGAHPTIGFDANLQKLKDACDEFTRVKNANAAHPEAAPQPLPYGGKDPCPIHHNVEGLHWPDKFEAARDLLGGDAFSALSDAQKDALVAVAREHAKNSYRDPCPPSPRPCGFSEWLRMFSRGQIGDSGGERGWDPKTNTEADAWIALRNSCWADVFLAACRDHELQLKTADGVAGYGTFLGQGSGNIVRSFFAADQAACEQQMHQAIGPGLQCTIGGACGASCGTPGPGCASAHPTQYGACVYGGSGLGYFVSGLTLDIKAYRDVAEAEAFMIADGSGFRSCPSASAASQYRPGTMGWFSGTASGQ